MIILSPAELVVVSLGWPCLMLLLLVYRGTRKRLAEWRQSCIEQRHESIDKEFELRQRIDRLKEEIADRKMTSAPIVPAEGYAPQCLTCHRPVKFDQVSLFVCPDCMEKNIDTITKG